jgi:chemotaxis protein MotB
MARKKKHEEHMNHEAWAIPYGDLITLLLAFFVVMYAISSVNEGKYRVLSDSLVAAFRGPPKTIQPIEVGEKDQGPGGDTKGMIHRKMVQGEPRSLVSPVAVKTELPSQPGTPVQREQLTRRAEAAAKALAKVADQVEQAMSELIKSDLVLVRRNDFWIEVEIRTDILFPSGSAQLSANAVGVIERLANVLAPLPNSVRVEGHTDDKPIKTVAFSSNWELSAARASSVVRVLSTHGVSGQRLAVIGYGENRPRDTNGTAEGRNANRRVVMVILSTDPTKDSAQPGAGAVAQTSNGTLRAP